MTDEVAMARGGLLDALEALRPHLNALVIIGAGSLPPHWSSGRCAGGIHHGRRPRSWPRHLEFRPAGRGSDGRGGFTPDPRPSAIGSWISPRGVPVDLMVPEAVAGAGRRGVRVPPHDPKSMRKARGIEATLVDNSKMLIRALDPADARQTEVSVAGPAALLVAKLHKIHDRIDNPSRLDNKDAHDVYRLLRAIDTEVFVNVLLRLLDTDASSGVTREALVYLAELFAGGAAAPGSAMAGAAEELVGDPIGVSESVALLAQDLLSALNR